MYDNENENNNSNSNNSSSYYTYTANYSPEEPELPKNDGGKKAGKIAAFILSVVIIGGASGFGGAYLANSMQPAEQTLENVSTETKSETTEIIQTVTAAPQNSGGKDDASLSNLLNADTAPSDKLTTEEIIKRATPSVVLITSDFKEAGGSGTGTGIVISADGYIITNCHVIETSYNRRVNSSSSNPFDNPFSFFGGGYYDIETVTAKADKVTITMSDGAEYEAKIIGSDENTDLALLKIDVEGLIPAVIGNSDELVLGETAITLGYPLGLGLSASGGMVSGLEKELTTELSNGGTASMTLIQTDASINPGNSGGPLLNGKGEVVGITSSKLVDSNIEGVGFAIPIKVAMSILDDLMNKGYVPVPKIGITGSSITSAVQRYYNLPVSSGVLVVSVETGSCADIAGIAEGDIIVAADGNEINDMDGLVAAKNRHRPGETMIVTLARNNGNVDIEIILDETQNESE